jgi:outer membrane lipopolysaccharide assembly protein LptE/RlpB
MRNTCQRRRALVADLILAFAVLSTAACGYRFSAGGRLGENITSVSVNMLENRTAETGVENIFTNDLIFEFTKNGNAIVESASADAVLSGTIEAMPVETVAYRGQVTSLERRITAFVSLRLSDRQGKVIWSANGISRSETYGILSEKVATDYNKREAIRALSERLAEDVYYRITDKF